jgi:16S rRNA (cytidine1402-2'-O)-methyltransferase
MGILYLVATPVGNLEDITLRALRVLREARIIAAEDTRTTRKLLSHFDITTPLISYYEHNELLRSERLLEALSDGDVALVSEAGMPAISDPGYELVRACIAAGVSVVPVPGASAVLAALVVSGLPTDRFLFLGFLPRRRGDRRRALERLREESGTLIVFEAPHRLVASLEDLYEVFGDRPLVVCRELTKVHEEIWRGRTGEALQWSMSKPPRGEYTLVIGGAAARKASEQYDSAKIREAISELVDSGIPASTAVRAMSRLTGLRKRELYGLIARQGPFDPAAGGDRESRRVLGN